MAEGEVGGKGAVIVQKDEDGAWSHVGHELEEVPQQASLLRVERPRVPTMLLRQRVVTRMEDGRANRMISQAKVGKFFIDDPTLGTTKILKVEIEVDDDLDEERRSANSKGNMVRMTAVLFPRFFQSFTDREEEYWAKARQLAGGKS